MNDNILDIYEVTPLQGGMLFHTLLAEKKSMYLDQIACRVKGSLNLPLFKRAWDEVIRGFSILRTGFFWEDLDKILQVVYKDVTLPFVEEDWSEDDEILQKAKLEKFLAQDRKKDFDLNTAPLMRVALLQLAPEEFYFVWTYHHILIDGWSVSNLIDKLFLTYHSLLKDGTFTLPPGPSFKGYISWLQKQTKEKSLEFWKEELAGYRSLSTLPEKKNSPYAVIRENVCARQEFLAEEKLTEALTALAKENQVTLYTIIQGVWALLLRQFNESGSIVFGGVTSGRSAEIQGFEDMVGLFINTVPVKIDLKDDLSVSQWLKEINQAHIKREQHSYCSLIDIQKQSEIDAEEDLFDSLVVFENFPKDSMFDEGNSDLEFSIISDFEHTSTKLSFSGTPGKRLSLQVHYDTAVYEPVLIERLLKQCGSLLSQMVENPGKKLGELSLMTPEFRHMVLEEWNRTDYKSPRKPEVLHFLFEEITASCREKTALKYEDQELSYGDLNSRANQLAHYLLKQGVEKESFVGICIERSLEMVIALLGVLKAGCAYIPLDPEYPGERLQFMLEDSKAPVVLTSASSKEKLSGESALVVSLDRDWEIISQEPDHNPGVEVSPEDLCYIIYTSGSTGKPKGAMNHHRGVVNRILWMDREYQLGPEDRILQKTPFSFDVSVWEFYWPLLTGNILVIARPGGHKDTDYLVDVIRKEKISIIHFVPSMLQLFLESPRVGEITTLRQVVCSGEALPYELQEKFFERMGTTALDNLYGPTEAAVDVTYWKCERGSVSRKVPIGKPVSNTRMYILDENLNPVPPGVTGELYIGGVQVCRGYLNRPELTAERFIEDPFLALPGSRMYRTGDLACYLVDGNIEYMGRVDHQVKIRGLRIELGEIESRILEYEGIREAVVIDVEEAGGYRSLAAYLVYGGEDLVLGDLREFIGVRLPEYMIPSRFVLLEKMPLNPSGKVDRGELVKLKGEKLTGKAEYTPAGNEIESALVEIWQELLGIQKIGIYDNFFELGGDSIIAIQVAARLGRKGYYLTPALLFQNQRIADLARAVSKDWENHNEQGMVEGEFGLIPVQRWFFEDNRDEYTHFNQSVLLELKEDISPRRVEEIFSYLLVHHDALRLRFARKEGRWIQELDSDASVRVNVIELPENVSSGTFITSYADGVQKSFKLEEAPLVKLVYFNDGKNQVNYLLIVIHHLVIDDVSWRIIMEDFLEIHRQLEASEKVILPLKTTSFKRWSGVLEEFSESEKALKELEYWKSLPVDNIKSLLPAQVQAGDKSRQFADTVSFSLDEEYTEKLLKEAPKAYNTQINDLLIAALGETIFQWCGSDLLIHLEGHGRETGQFPQVDLSRTIGWFTTVFPVLIKHLQGDTGVLIKNCKESLHRIPEKGFNYGILKYLSGEEKTAGVMNRIPGAEILFNYLGQFDQGLNNGSFTLSDISTGTENSREAEMRYLIEINGMIMDRKLELDWTFSRKIFGVSSIQKLAENYRLNLMKIIDFCLNDSAGGFTPSDFPELDMNQDELDGLLDQIADIPQF